MENTDFVPHGGMSTRADSCGYKCVRALIEKSVRVDIGYGWMVRAPCSRPGWREPVSESRDGREPLAQTLGVKLELEYASNRSK